MNAIQRPVRSYVLRQGRISPAQERALEELLPRYGIAFADRPIDAQRIFGRSAPLVLEIGSGMGETTAAIAQARPETDFIAVEVHGPGVGSLLKRIAELGLMNLRAIRHDASEVLDQMIELSRTPVLLSHSGARAIFDHPRNVDDGRLRKLAASGGGSLGLIVASRPLPAARHRGDGVVTFLPFKSQAISAEVIGASAS